MRVRACPAAVSASIRSPASIRWTTAISNFTADHSWHLLERLHARQQGPDQRRNRLSQLIAAKVGIQQHPALWLSLDQSAIALPHALVEGQLARIKPIPDIKLVTAWCQRYRHW